MAYPLLLLLPGLLHAAAALGGGPGKAPLHRGLAAAALAAATVAVAASAATGVPGDWLAAGPLHLVMAVLVNVVGLVVIRYASVSLQGDVAEQRCLAGLHACLAAVNLLVVTNHLLVLWMAWTAISIALHQLLVCYPERFRAVLAAHKKFLFARVAEAAVLGAVLLLWHEHGTFRIDQVLAAYAGGSALSLASQVAAVLLAAAALIKCAQLPVHGWLIQVVEAPTPVSALLHAGVINLGGYLMILMAPLVTQSAPARWLLLVVAGLTAVLAALVMMTRISVKVRLAWSTSAQMGLMLVECALGLHALALLHLVGHACYKAGAFLGAGNAVNDWLAARVAGEARPAPSRLLAGGVLAVTLVLAAAALFPQAMHWPEVASWSLVAAASGTWLAGSTGSLAARAILPGALLLAYVTQKMLFGALLPPATDPGLPAALWVIALAFALVAGQAALLAATAATASAARDSTWRRWLFAGLYLDEAVTRATLRLWPVPLPRPAKQLPAHADDEVTHVRPA